MKRFHAHVRVDDLESSVRFYSTLFGTEPAVRKPDYAKWMLEDPRVNVSIAEKPGAYGIEHLGIQAESPAELEELRSRIARAGGFVRNEGETTCCYAKSDKTWTVDPQGVVWETFRTLEHAPVYGESRDRSRPVACCGADLQRSGT